MWSNGNFHKDERVRIYTLMVTDTEHTSIEDQAKLGLNQQDLRDDHSNGPTDQLTSAEQLATRLNQKKNLWISTLLFLFQHVFSVSNVSSRWLPCRLVERALKQQPLINDFISSAFMHSHTCICTGAFPLWWIQQQSIFLMASSFTSLSESK